MVVNMVKYEKPCVICGTKIITNCISKKYCSSNCTKVAIRRRYNPKPKLCATCGKELLDRRQQWCLDCLLMDYHKTHSYIAYHRLENRGFDKSSILQELKNRGIE